MSAPVEPTCSTGVFFHTNDCPAKDPKLLAMRKEQGKGREPAMRETAPRTSRRGTKLTHDGLSLSLREWALRTGIDRFTIAKRLDDGWTVERALTTPKVPSSESLCGATVQGTPCPK